MTKGQNVAYRRVSSLLQNEARQLEGMRFDREFLDKISGKDKNRPALNECLEYIREGDTLHVHSMDRLARNLGDMENIVRSLVGRGVTVKFHKENLTFSNGKDNPANTLLLQIMGAFAQFELSMIRERQREGIAIAKKKGKHIGRKASLDESRIGQVRDLWESGRNKTEIAAEMDVSRVTLYEFLKRHRIQLETRNIAP